MAFNDTADLINSLCETITKAIEPVFPKSRKFALLDFPNYGNVGDSAIWLGQIALFEKTFNAVPSYVSFIGSHSHEELKKAVPEGPVFLQGGGNFGDLWPDHQKFREDILKEFPERPVIQLPQSIHFDDPENLKNAAAIINAHPDFTLFVRDHKSLGTAREHFDCKTVLCPDMALCLGSLQTSFPASRPLLLLLRTDKEKRAAGSFSSLIETYPPEDWTHEQPGLYQRVRKRTIPELPLTLGPQAFNKNVRRELFYRRLAENRLKRGLKQLSSAEFVISDRLHVHIICLLLGLPHVILDNSYGKIGNFAAAWTEQSELFQQAGSLEQAFEIYNAPSVDEEKARALADS